MKTIKYNNKEYKLPFDVALPDDPTAEVEIANRFSGEKTTMPEFAAAVYDAETADAADTSGSAAEAVACAGLL